MEQGKKRFGPLVSARPIISNILDFKIMQLKKMSLKEIQGILSRDEMKKIMAGSGSNKCDQSCSSNSDCDPHGGTCQYCDVNTAWDNDKFCYSTT